MAIKYSEWTATRTIHALGNQDTAATWDWDTGAGGFSVTLTGDATINAPTTAPTISGKIIYFFVTITQDATGGRVPSWNAAWKNTPTLSTDPNAVDYIAGVYDGTNYILGSPVKVTP